MSLIERAIARLSDAPGIPTGGEDKSDTQPVATERGTTIERLADRLATRAPNHEPAIGIAAAPAARASDRPAPSAAASSPERIDAVGTAPVAIQLEALRARGMAVPDGPTTAAAQEFRVIKRPLLHNAFGRDGQEAVRHGRRIMVTSAFPGEGKSFCAINLALSIAAERDHQVILVDADVARPSIPRELGIQASAGLMDWLSGDEQNLSALILRTNVDKLSVLMAGRRHEQATEMLASEAMARLLDRLDDSYADCVFVFDSPPLLVTTEARVLASYMGQIMMVVEAGKTPHDAVTEALATIESNEIIGLVLNKAQNIENSGYFQGYGYGSH